jgi:peptidoglycan/LPS O-acetylase OafA/YrhL
LSAVLESRRITQQEADGRAPAEAGYWTQIDGLRAIAFLLVFISHLGGIAPAVAGSFMNKLANCGWVGVDLFFVISGFLITALLVREKEKYGEISFKQFYLRRALRILPVYYLVLFIACIAVPIFGVPGAPKWNNVAPFFWPVLVPFLLFVGNYTMAWRAPQLISLQMRKGVNLDCFLAPFWSLCVEEQFYLFWPFLVQKLKSARKMLLTCLGFSLLALVVRFFLQHYAAVHPEIVSRHVLYYSNTICRLDTLMIGAALAITNQYYPAWFAKLGKFGGLFFFAAVGGFTAMVLSGINICDNPAAIVPVMSGVALMFGALLLASLTFQPFGALMAWGPVSHFGRLTYAMYCFHVPVLNEVGKHLHLTGWAASNWWIDWSIKLVVSLTCTYLLALLSWHLMEKHCMQLRKVLHKHIDKKRPAPVLETV